VRRRLAKKKKGKKLFFSYSIPFEDEARMHNFHERKEVIE
jgi:hypothetical protein